MRVYTAALRPSPNPSRVSFVIFAQGRSGSSLLVDLMRSHPDVHCDEEILDRRVLLPSAWVRAHRRRHPDSHYGFKVKPYQLTVDQRLDPRAWLTRMHDRGWRLIRLTRRTVLRHALSNMVAEHVGRYVFRGGSAPEASPITVDVDMLLGAMAVRTEQAGLERGALAGLPYVQVTYEDDLLDARAHQATLDRISAGIGLPSANARTDVRRITGDDLRETIANYDEVASAVGGTEWAPLLDDPASPPG